MCRSPSVRPARRMATLRQPVGSRCAESKSVAGFTAPEARSGQSNPGQRFASPSGGGGGRSLRIAPPVVRERPDVNAPRPSAPSYSAPRQSAPNFSAPRQSAPAPRNNGGGSPAGMAAEAHHAVIPVEVTATAAGKSGFRSQIASVFFPWARPLSAGVGPFFGFGMAYLAGPKFA